MAANPFVAREPELAELEQFLEQVRAGSAQVVFVAGEAGAGKSALLHEFIRHAEAGDPSVVAALGQCSAQTGVGDAYLPFREVLTALTGTDDEQQARSAVTPTNAARLQELARVSAETLLDVAPDLVGIFVPGASLIAKILSKAAQNSKLANKLAQVEAKPPINPTLEQAQIFQQYTQTLQALAKDHTLILILDDLHWADSASLNLLFHLARRLQDSRVLLVGAYRPEDVALGRDGKRHPLEPVLNELRRYQGDIVIDLDATREHEGRAFVDALIDSEPNRLDEAFRQELFVRTGGHPLFTIELLRNLQERGDLVRDATGRWVRSPTLEWELLPARVEGVIEERIARLTDELRQTLTIGSVMGLDFLAQVIGRVQQIPERTLLGNLARELDKRHHLIQEKGETTVGQQMLSWYRFSHALVQEYLYSDLGEGERRLLHGDVAAALEELYAGLTDAVAVQLAYHFLAARRADKAVHYLTLAGEQAVRAVAYTEASRHFTEALAQLATLPETPERTQRELGLLLSLGAVLTARKGYTDPQVVATYSRMRELLPKLGQVPEIFPALMALERLYAFGGKGQLQYEVAAQALDLAESLQDPKLLMGGHQVMGNALLLKGQFAAARTHFEQSLALYDPQEKYAINLPDDPGVAAGAQLGWTLWRLGFAEQALVRSQAALKVAQGFANRPYPETNALYILALIHFMRRDAPATRQTAEAAIALAVKHGFSYQEAMSRVLYGWAQVEQGEIERGIEQIQRSVAALSTINVAGILAPVLAVLASVYGQVDRVDEGLALAAEVQEMGDRPMRMEADLYLLQGTLQMKRGDDDQAAEASLQRAIAITREQEAKSYELRATVQLARLWRAQGKSPKARQMLADLYGWFSEGFDTVDLREAKALLDELQMTGA